MQILVGSKSFCKATELNQNSTLTNTEGFMFGADAFIH
jgi:hypothetical protein